MSNVLGIIAEYNPFHNGHLYHLKEAKKLTNSDYTIAVISGNFTQRGSTSLVDKWSKARMALLNGVDLVLELPVWYSVSSAENFADGAVKILNSLGIVDHIAFGAEISDINILNEYAEILYTEPEEYKKSLSLELKKGLSFPKARENAIYSYIKNINDVSINLTNASTNILSSPNNILGIEYLKALKKHKSNIQPLSIPRIKSDYNSTSFSDNIASATSIRELVKKRNLEILSTLMPMDSYSILMDVIKNENIIPDINIFEKEITYILRKKSITEISQLPDVSEGLEFAIKKAANNFNTIDEILNSIKSKRYTITRLQRILLYALLDIKKEDLETSKNVVPYIRVLGFNSKGTKLLSNIHKSNPNLPIITQVKKFLDNENSNSVLKNMLECDIFATNIYTIGFKNNSLCNLDFTHRIETSGTV